MSSISDEKRKEIFARNLNYYIEKVNKSQKVVAKECGVTPQSLNNWLQRLSLPRMGIVQKLADYFGIKYTDLLEEHELPEIDPFEDLWPFSDFDSPEENNNNKEPEKNSVDIETLALETAILKNYSTEEIIAALKLYEKFKNASPRIKGVIQDLLIPDIYNPSEDKKES